MKKETRRKIFLYTAVTFGIILALGLLTLLIQDYYPQIKELFNPNADRAYLKQAFRHHGLKDACLLIGLTAILTAIPGAPVAVICIFNGVLYGPWAGILMNLIGYVLGDLLVVYLLAHFNFIKKSKNFKKQMASFKRFKNPALAIILGYAIPFIPSSFTSYMAVKLKMKLSKLVTCIAIGTLPTSLLYAFGGDAVFKGNTLRMIIAVVLIVIIFAGLVKIYHEFSKKRREDEVLK
nr:VTT domain-containing protein [uncultured Ligilactobacillus sp.]